MDRKLKALIACGLVGGLASAAAAQEGSYLVNISGATLLENLITAPAISNDYIDVDDDGFARVNLSNDQLAPFALPPAFGGRAQNTQWWIIDYRAVGSVRGFQEMVNFGRTFVRRREPRRFGRLR